MLLHKLFPLKITGSGKSCKTKCLITPVFDIFSSLRFLPRQLNGPLENAPYQRKIE